MHSSNAKAITIVCFKGIEVKDIDRFFDLDEYKETKTMTEYLGKNYKRNCVYFALREKGHRLMIGIMDGYWVDGQEYRLTIEDGLKLRI